MKLQGKYLPVVLLAFSLVPPARAEEPKDASERPAAVVELARGTVEFKRAGADEWKPAPIGTKLDYGDLVRTGRRSRAKLSLGNHIRISLSSNSVAEIQVPRQNGTPSVGMLLGSLLARVAHGDGPRPFEVHTSSAVAGVRGTVFEVAAAEDGSCLTTVQEGAVAVEAFAAGEGEGPSEPMLVKAGRAVEVEEGGRPVFAKELDTSRWLSRRRQLWKKKGAPEAAWKNVKRRLARYELLLERIQKLEARLLEAEKEARRARRAGRQLQFQQHAQTMGRLLDRLAVARFELRRLHTYLVAKEYIAANLPGIGQKAGKSAGPDRARVLARISRVRSKALARLRNQNMRLMRMMAAWRLSARGLSPLQKWLIRRARKGRH
ncbi:MAG: hypothetical protein D6806_05625 [Deltaproteobacteria bacterium]|nr:MAG: hypothetical protein D6806_05625 [Deltaproteobacteria bacterium]